MQLRSTSVIALLALCGVSAPVHAEGGSCSYPLYSTYLNRTIPVCQNATSADQCGAWPKSKVPANSRVMASAVGKESGDLRLVASRCNGSGAVGVCLIPTGEVYFYEGDAKQLASGCRWMRGEWKAFAADARPTDLLDAMGRK